MYDCENVYCIKHLFMHLLSAVSLALPGKKFQSVNNSSRNPEICCFC